MVPPCRIPRSRAVLADQELLPARQRCAMRNFEEGDMDNALTVMRTMACILQSNLTMHGLNDPSNVSCTPNLRSVECKCASIQLSRVIPRSRSYYLGNAKFRHIDPFHGKGLPSRRDELSFQVGVGKGRDRRVQGDGSGTYRVVGKVVDLKCW